MSAALLEDLFTAWRALDARRAAALFTADGTYAEAGKPPLVGRDAMIAHWEPFFALGAFWRLDIAEVFGDGTRFAVRYRWSEDRPDGTNHHHDGCALVHTRSGAVADYREYAG